MSRRLILLTPVLLIAGIVVQVVALVLVAILWIPCLIRPGILNGPYQWITTAGARLAMRSILGKSRKSERVVEAESPI